MPATEEASPVAVKKSKTPKSSEDAPKAKSTKKATVEAASVKPTKAKKDNTSAAKKVNGAEKPKKGKKEVISEPESPSDDEDDHEPVAEEAEEDSELDDQTEALLKGFESDDDEEDATNEEGLQPGQEIPDAKISKKTQKQLQVAAESDASEKPGVVYIGRIPHGFYENEMKAYFRQFGNILKLRLSRNRRTGASKHVAWIQFESATVADIVARTMDNYLLFGHILKVKIVPDEQIPENLFKGANKRFKKVPWNKMEGRILAQGASEEVWDKRAEKEEAKRADRAKVLKEIGYEFDSPKIKSAKGVSKKKKTITNGGVEVKTIEPAPAAEESSNPKTEKKGKPVKEEVKAIEPAPVAEQAEKPKRGTKSNAVKEPVEEAAAHSEEPSKPKEKKNKKKKAEEAEAPEVAAEVPEKKLKAKKSKTALTEKSSEENAKKGKKNKKTAA